MSTRASLVADRAGVGDERDRPERGADDVEGAVGEAARERVRLHQRHPYPASGPRRAARAAACRRTGPGRPPRRPGWRATGRRPRRRQPSSSTRRPRTSPSRCASASRWPSGHQMKSTSPRNRPCRPGSRRRPCSTSGGWRPGSRHRSPSRRSTAVRVVSVASWSVTRPRSGQVRQVVQSGAAARRGSRPRRGPLSTPRPGGQGHASAGPAAPRPRCARPPARAAACPRRGPARPPRRPARSSHRAPAAAPAPSSRTRLPRTSPSSRASASRRPSGTRRNPRRRGKRRARPGSRRRRGPTSAGWRRGSRPR